MPSFFQLGKNVLTSDADIKKCYNQFKTYQQSLKGNPLIGSERTLENAKNEIPFVRLKDDMPRVYEDSHYAEKLKL